MSDDQKSVAKADNSDRIIGTFALIGSGVLGYICIISPLLTASKHGDSVSLSMKGVIVVPVIFAIGIMNLVMGEKARPILGRRKMPSPLGWVIYVATFGIGILLYLWLKSKLQDYGYQT